MNVCLNAIKLQAVAFAIPAKVRAEVLAGEVQKWWQNEGGRVAEFFLAS